MNNTMQLKDLRKQLKAIGYNVKCNSNSLGTFAKVVNSEGVKMPSIFFSDEQLGEWQPAIDIAKSFKHGLVQGEKPIMLHV